MAFGRLRRRLARLTRGPSSAGLSLFISYRRDDSSRVATSLYDVLSDHFGAQLVPMDDFEFSDSDWAESITRAIDSFTIVLALIGPSWTFASDQTGRRALDRPDDAVRLQLQKALELNARVIPVLVDGAMMPTYADLPPSLRPLAERQAVELRPEHLHDDVTGLIAVLDRFNEAALDVPWGAIEPLPSDS